MGAYKCDVCDKVFTEKRNLLRREKNTHDKTNSYTCELCNKVYGRAEHLFKHTASTHCKSTKVQCSECKKTFTRAYNLKKHKCKLDQETGCICDSNKASRDDMTAEQPTEKTLVNMFFGEASSINKPPIKKRCLKESSANRAPDERHKSLNIKCSNLYEVIKEGENQQSMESDPKIRAFMQKYWTSSRTFTKRGKVQNIFNFFYDRDFKDWIEKITHRIIKYQNNRFKINYSLAFIF